jgi:hypothetical protein
MRKRDGLLLSLVLFRLVAPPLQPRVVGPYPIWGVWLPSCLLLEGDEDITSMDTTSPIH